MERLQKPMRSAISESQDGKFGSTISSTLDKAKASFNSSGSSPALSSSATTSDPSQLLLTRPPKQVVSLWTCSKLCAIFFAAGVVVGYTLKQRVRRWAAKLLRRLKDD